VTVGRIREVESEIKGKNKKIRSLRK